MSRIFNEDEALEDPGLVELIACWRKNTRAVRRLHLLLEDHDNVIAYLNSHITVEDMHRDLMQETPEFRRNFIEYLKTFQPRGDC